MTPTPLQLTTLVLCSLLSGGLPPRASPSFLLLPPVLAGAEEGGPIRSVLAGAEEGGPTAEEGGPTRSAMASRDENQVTSLLPPAVLACWRTVSQSWLILGLIQNNET
jgi:hypothetical protein